MKYSLISLILVLFCGSGTPVVAQVTLPVEAASPPGSASQPGLWARVVQAPEETPLDNNFLRALRQLNGTLVSAEGGTVENIAAAGPLAEGFYEVEVVDFTTEPFITFGQFFEHDQIWPGLEEGGPAGLFAVELVTYLNLPAGTIKMGISAGFARTDEIDDDGWRLFCGPQARSFFAPLVAEYARTALPFPNETELNTGNANEFTITVPQAGVYPFRLVYWQQTRKSLLEWYVVLNPDTASEERLLLNADSETAFAHQTITGAPLAVGPYVAEVSPLPGGAGVPAAQPVEILLADGTTTVDPASVKLTLNGAAVTPQEITRTGSKVYVSFTPNAARTESQNALTLEFKDTAGLTINHAWSFTSTVSGATTAAVTGQWDFDRGDLSATVGAPLAYLTGTARAGTQFGTTRDFDLPDINGRPALVMAVPGELSRDIGYIMTHGIAPNGGGTLVNQYTIIYDVFVATEGANAASLLQIDSLDNTNDGDLFWQGGNFGQGENGYLGTGQFTAGAWHRVAAAYDLAADPPVVVKYVDGIKQDDWTFGQSLDHPRRALRPTAILFADGDPDERRAMFVNSIQIRAGKLSDAEMVLLGGPEATGIPAVIPTANVAGQWDFDRGDLSPTIGAALAYFGGNGGLAQTDTQFGTPEEFGIDDLPDATEEVPSRVMAVPGELSRDIGYVMTHGIAPNGSGTLVNQYTIIYDVFVATEGANAASLLQIDSLDNTNDGDLFWQGGNFGQGENGYLGTGQFTAGAWHRVAAAYDLAADPPVVVKYVDGIKQDDWTFGQSLDHPRRALRPTAILFADGDPDERRAMFVNSIQIRPGRLSDAQLALLGGPSTAGIPVALPASSITGQWDFNRGDLSATIGTPLTYFDGAAGVTAIGTTFGTTTDLGVLDFEEGDALVMAVPGDVTREVGYLMTHRIAPNGGGTLVNQYTVIFDVMVDTSGRNAAAMLQIDSTANTNDGDLFWQGGNFGQGENGYIGTGQFTPGEWHRVAAAYDLAANPPVVVKYVDGVFQDNWTTGQSLDHPRRALLPTAILFADGDEDERRAWWVNSIQIHDRALSPAVLEALGGPQAEGLPLALPEVEVTEPTLHFGRGATGFLLLWRADVTGWVLERSTNLGTWGPVQGVTDNYALITEPGPAFFRLRLVE